MATTARPRPKPIKVQLVTGSDRALAGGASLMLAAMLTALAFGRDHWDAVPPIVWGHMATIALALAITPVMMLRRRGDRLHRRLGWVWAGSLFVTALMSFGIRDINDGALSPIHILSAITLVGLFVVVSTARNHQHAAHRAAVRGLAAGALLIAGFFTLVPGRSLGEWLWG